MPVPENIQITDVTSGAVERLADLERLLLSFFPGFEKFIPLIRQRAVRNDADVVSHQWVIDVDGEPAGFYLFDYLPRRCCGLTLFIGLYPQFRSRAVAGYTRLAHYLIAESQRQIAQDARRLGEPAPLGLAVEVEQPALLPRYRQYDFIDLPVVYYEPMFPAPCVRYSTNIAAADIRYERAALGLFHAQPVAPALSRDQVAGLALAFLQGFYQLPVDSWAVQQALVTAQAMQVG